MKSWILSDHAATVIFERQIDEAWIDSALTSPDAVIQYVADPQLEHVLRRIPEADNKVLRVIYNARRSPIMIVTAFFDRRERRRREGNLR
jgi:hypothetical protein